jgi:hypothetical protein
MRNILTSHLASDQAGLSLQFGHPMGTTGGVGIGGPAATPSPYNAETPL